MTVLRVAVDDGPAAQCRALDADWAALRRIVAEALILQDAAEDLLAQLRRRPDPSEVARPCGRIKARLADLRAALPDSGDPALDRHAAAVRQVLDHHLLLLVTSLGLLAGAQRSAALDDRLDDVDDLGAPARRLDAVWAELLANPRP